jgi:hypothetical protein
VPESFKDVVLDSRQWLQNRAERMEALMESPNDLICRLISLFFSKMEANVNEANFVGPWCASTNLVYADTLQKNPASFDVLQHTLPSSQESEV